ncbi:MAG: cysteine-rich CWC family protein [Panacibacter sp.]
MAEKIPAILSWSGGKDCAYTLCKVLQEAQYDVKYLLSFLREETRALNMHEVSEILIEQQAAATGIPLIKVFVSDSSNTTYEKQLANAIEIVKAGDIHHIIFGDLFLQDLRQYREVSMQQLGMNCVFPIWQIPSHLLMNDFIGRGFRAITCCIDAVKLSKDFIGRELDHSFINDLPEEVDPCGENGEYHSFCYDAPCFLNPVEIHAGRIYFKPLELKTLDKAGSKNLVQGYWFCELLAAKLKGTRKECARCRQPFNCRQEDISNCHCYGIVISPEANEKIKGKYTGCLCRQCLQQLAEHNTDV